MTLSPYALTNKHRRRRYASLPHDHSGQLLELRWGDAAFRVQVGGVLISTHVVNPDRLRLHIVSYELDVRAEMPVPQARRLQRARDRTLVVGGNDGAAFDSFVLAQLTQ